MGETAAMLMQKPSEDKTFTSAVHADGDSVNQNSSLFPAPIEEIPVIDYSALTSAHPEQQSKAVDHLAKALHYGFFAVINHGLPDELIKRTIDGFFGFFDRAEEEKQEYQPKNQTDGIRWGKGFKAGDQNIVKREFLKLVPHPIFHCPHKPAGFSEVFQEYTTELRKIILRFLRVISKNMGLEECYIEKAMKLESGFEICAGNIYPANLESEIPLGLPTHCDPGLLIALIQNVNGGLQFEHNGNFVNVDAPPNSILVNVGDQLEILTNGLYQSAPHRVLVNNKVRRISVPITFGPALDVAVSPAPEFVNESRPVGYRTLVYKDYLMANQYDPIDAKSCLPQVRL